MARQRLPSSPSNNTVQQRRSFAPKLWMLALGFVALLLTWQFAFNGALFKTSTLNTSFNRLSSTEVKLSIPDKTPGKFDITAGPSQLLKGATVFAVTLDVGTATLTNPTTPFTVDSTVFKTLINAPNPDDAKEMMLAVVFPEGTFDTKETLIAELPFATTVAGQFEVKSVYFGSLPSSSFPPFQDYPVFIESSNFLYDEKGAAKILATTATTTTTTVPQCSDGIDNDGDGKIDYPADPGCTSALDNDETDPVGPKPVRLDIPTQFIKTVQAPDLKTETIAILPPAQEQLQYEFTLKATGGTGQYTFGVQGRTPNANGDYPLENSGLLLSSAGVLTGQPDALVAANYRYPAFVTDGTDSYSFTLQIAVHDAFGNPIGLDIETNFTGEHRCVVDQVCEAFFKANNGIEPYIYGFSGEKPPALKSFLQVNAGEAFYRFIPTMTQVGSYQITVSVHDSSKKIGSTPKTTITKIATVNPAPTPGATAPDATVATPPAATTPDTTSTTPTVTIPPGATTPAASTAPAAPSTDQALVSTPNTAEITFTLVISGPVVASSFKYAADCNFLDLSDIDPTFNYFQFACLHGIIVGKDGLVRPNDSMNRAEAAKVTTLIFSDESEVNKTFKAFQLIAPGTPVNFQDVTVGDWYASFVYYLFKQGLVVNNTYYRPSDTLNNAEAMKLVIEAYASLSDDLIKDLLDITDYDQWYKPYQTVASYVDAGISKIDPTLPAQRAQIAELIYKLNKAYPSKKFQ